MNSEIEVKEKTEVKIPSMYKVLILNDDYTPMDFVVMILREVFEKSSDAAIGITLSVHNEGAGVCGVYPKEVALIKSKQVNTIAGVHSYPLKSIVEKE